METFPKKYGNENDCVNKPQETQHETSEAKPVESSCVLPYDQFMELKLEISDGGNK
jgi:hypothetical protein